MCRLIRPYSSLFQSNISGLRKSSLLKHGAAAHRSTFHLAKELSMTSLRQRFIEDMQVRNFSPVTQASYNAATAAITSGPVTTAAGIVIAQNVSHSHVPSGLKNEPPKFSTRTIFMSSSRSPNRLFPSLTRTKISSTAYSSEPLPRPYPPSLPIPNIWAPRSVFSPYFTVGDRTCFSIRICIVSFQAEGFHLMVPGGFPAAPTFSYP